jgi:hypothetical protein
MTQDEIIDMAERGFHFLQWAWTGKNFCAV